MSKKKESRHIEVVKKIILDKNDPKRTLCFGSRLSRTRLYVRGGKPRDYPGPFEHFRKRTLLRKGPNKKGYTLLASIVPRDKDFRATASVAPPVGTYDVEPAKPPKQLVAPFGVSTPLTKEEKFLTPAPGAYSFFKRQIKVCTAFGHDKIPVPLAKIVCGQFNMAVCMKCEQVPVGDYWHKDSTHQDMCRPCMERECAELRKCATKILVRHRKMLELGLFSLRRYCEFYHEHNCTKAAVQMMPTRDLIAKLRKENYLASFGL